jgi:hypothetical protein
MKHIKKFESFHDTGVDDGGGEVIPEHNPVTDLKIKEFVEDTLNKGGYVDLAKMIGDKVPNDLTSDQMGEFEDQLKEKAIKFFTDNPEALPNEIGVNTYKVPGGDGITRTNKVGGTSHTNSFRIGQ